MSTKHASSPIPAEEKLDRLHELKSNKDDIKMQNHVHMKEQKNLPQEPLDAEVPTDNAGLVGGVINVANEALHKGINMLPASMQDKATALADKAIEVGSGLGDRALNTVNSITSIPSNTIHGLQTRAAGIQTSVTERAVGLQHTLDDKVASYGLPTSSQAITQIKEAIAPIKESYQKDGVVAAAKTSIAVGSTAAGQLKTQGMSALSAGKAKLLGANGEEAPKKHGRRRRGGRRHGNRKLKTKSIEKPDGESILDSLGEHASKIKEVVVEKMPKSSSSGSGIIASAQGLVGSVTSTASGIVQNAKDTASGLVNKGTELVSGATASAQGIVTQAQAAATGATQALSDKIVDLKGNSKAAPIKKEAGDKKSTSLKDTAAEKIAPLKDAAVEKITPLKNAAVEKITPLKEAAGEKIAAAKELASEKLEVAKDTLQKGKKQVDSKLSANKPASAATEADKPEFDRRSELPALGTPSTPGDAPLKFEAKGDSSLVGQAKFRIGQATDMIKEKISDLTENADDTTPMEGAEDNKGVLAKAGKQLEDLKAKVTKE